MPHRDRGIGQSLGRCGPGDVVALRRVGFLAIGPVVDDHRKARGLRLGHIRKGYLWGDAIVGGQGTKIAHRRDV